MTFALFRNGKQVSKAHSTKDAVAAEAFELGAVLTWSGDFKPGSGIILADGYEIKEIDHGHE